MCDRIPRVGTEIVIDMSIIIATVSAPSTVSAAANATSATIALVSATSAPGGLNGFSFTSDKFGGFASKG